MSLESVFKLSLVMDMVDRLTGPMAGVNASVDGSLSKLQKIDSALGGLTKTGIGMSVVGQQITEATLAPVEATFETRKALGELASLGVKDLQAVEDAARDFSDTWAGTTKADFISAAYDIKSGIASLSDEGVAQFTELAALTGKATKSTAGEMTSLFATGYGIYKGYYEDMSDLEFGGMFSGGISQAVKQFKTAGSEMASSIEALGASATNAGVPLEEQLTILGMLQATMSGSEAGTQYNAFLRSAAKGGKALGLSFLDANNQLKNMPEILAQLRAKYGETIDATEKMKLQEAFGDEGAVALIDLMYNKVGDLQGNILEMYDALGQGTGVTEEMATAMNNMEPEQFEVLKQQLHNVAETAGNTLLPTVNKMMEGASQMIAKGAEWIDNHQQLVQVLLLVALALGGFLTVAGGGIAVISGIGLVFTKSAGLARGFWGVLKGLPGALETAQIYGMYAADAIQGGFRGIRSAGGIAISGIRNVGGAILSMAKGAAVSGVTALKNMALGMIGMAKQAIITAVTAMPGLIASVWSFTAALLANPITWIVVGIVALIAVLVLLWQHWDQVSLFLQTTWNTVCNAITGGIDWIKQGFLSIITWITGKISWFGDAGKKLVTTFVEGIKSVAMAPVNAIKGIFGKIGDLLPHSDAKEGPLSTLTLSGQRTMTTYADGVSLEEDAPALAVERSMSRVGVSLEQDPPRKVTRQTRAGGDEDETKAGSSTRRSGGVIIQKLIIQADINKMKELKDLLRLLKELEDYDNSSDEEPDGDLDPALA